MSFSPRPPSSGTRRPNAVIDSASRSLAWAAHELAAASNAVMGRESLVAADIAELRRRIASATATIAKVSAELVSPASGLLVRGASNDHPAVEGGLRS
jgi:uncharacterized small protein (DUF1192 family)